MNLCYLHRYKVKLDLDITLFTGFSTLFGTQLVL